MTLFSSLLIRGLIRTTLRGSSPGQAQDALDSPPTKVGGTSLMFLMPDEGVQEFTGQSIEPAYVNRHPELILNRTQTKLDTHVAE